MRQRMPFLILLVVAVCGVLIYARQQRGDLLKSTMLDVIEAVDCAEMDQRYLKGLVERHHASVHVPPHAGVIPIETQKAYIGDVFDLMLADMREGADIALIRKVEAARDKALGQSPAPQSAPNLEKIETAYVCTACGHGFRLNILELQQAVTSSLAPQESKTEAPRVVRCTSCGAIAARPGRGCASCGKPFLPTGGGSGRTFCPACRPTLWLCTSTSCGKTFEISADALASTAISDIACPACGKKEVGLAAVCPACRKPFLVEGPDGPTRNCPHCNEEVGEEEAPREAPPDVDENP